MARSARQSKARLLWMLDYGGPYAGSHIALLRAAVGAAQDRGWVVQVAFSPVARGRSWLDELDADGIPVRFAPTEVGAATRWISQILAESELPAVLHSHYTTFDVPAALAALRAGRPRPAVFWHVRSQLGGSRRVPLVTLARNAAKFTALARTVDGIFTTEADVRSQVIHRGAPARRVEAIPNPIDTERFTLCTTNERDAARAALDLPADATVLLHFGWDWHRKGGDLFLEAMRLLVDGEGSSGRHFVALMNQGGEPARELAERLSLSQRVRLLEPRDDVETLHAAADVMLSTSRGEGTPLAAAEALSRGTPVVATDIPGHAYVARHATACRLVSADPGAIAGAVDETLARSDREAEAEARQGHGWVEEGRSMSAWVELMLAHYQRALDHRGWRLEPG